MEHFEIGGVSMTKSAAEFVEECGVDVEHDLSSLRAGRSTRETLLTGCLEASDPDREEGIRDYVSAVCAVAGC